MGEVGPTGAKRISGMRTRTYANHTRTATGVVSQRGVLFLFGGRDFNPQLRNGRNALPAALVKLTATVGYRPGWHPLSPKTDRIKCRIVHSYYTCVMYAIVAYGVGPTAGIFMNPTAFHMQVLLSVTITPPANNY
jgi:hypothetical protein